MIAAKPILVPPGGFSSNEEEARWLADTIGMRTIEALSAIGVSASVPTGSLYELLIIALQATAKRAHREARQDHDRRVAELLAANNAEVERRREIEVEHENARSDLREFLRAIHALREQVERLGGSPVA